MPRVRITVGGEAGEPGYGLRELGRNISELGPRFRQLREDERRAKEQERQFAIQEQRAQASLLREQNLAAKAEGAAAEDEANRQAVITTIQEEGEKARGQAQQEQVRRALASPEGMLGPFGMATALAKGAPNTIKTQERWAGYEELAKRMDPRFAKSWLDDTLKRDAAEEKQRILTDGYNEEVQQLDAAIKEGWFEDPFGPSGSGDELSDETQALAESLTKEIRTGLAAGTPPGKVSKILALAHAKRKKLVARKKSWERADFQAEKVLESIEDMATAGGQDVDPLTGKSLGQELTDRLATARGEWAGTLGLDGVSESYRREHDPDKDLAELKKILFNAHAQANPQGFLAAQSRAPGPTQNQVVQAVTGSDSQQNAPGQAGLQPPQAAPGARQAPGAPEAKRGRKPASQEALVQSMVQESLGATLQAGGKADRTAAIKGLLDRLEHDLGLDVDDPKVREMVRNAISQTTGQ